MEYSKMLVFAHDMYEQIRIRLCQLPIKNSAHMMSMHPHRECDARRYLEAENLTNLRCRM